MSHTRQYEEAKNCIDRTIRHVAYANPQIEALCRVVLSDTAFQEWPGSIDKHHAYKGGLLVHTAEVLEYCMQHVGPTVDWSHGTTLLCAAIFHDWAKTRDYERYLVKSEDRLGFRKSGYYAKIRHVAGSYAFWQQWSHGMGVSSHLQDEVGHCILAHHGRKEWGSPVEPQTAAALILHQADLFSSRFGAGR